MIEVQKNKEGTVKKFFSWILAVAVLAAGFAALPANAEANEAVVNFGQPKVVVSPEVAVTIVDEFSFDNFRAYIFTLKNDSPDTARIYAGFGSDWKYGFKDGDPVFYQWWTFLISPTGEKTTNSQEFRLEPGGEYTLSLTVQILGVRGSAMIFPFLNQRPQLNDVTFRMSDGVVYASWRSSGNFAGELVKMGIWRTPNEPIHFAYISDGGGHSVYIESWPRGEYYITLSLGGMRIFSPLYSSPGQRPGQR